jgi:MFS family permease
MRIRSFRAQRALSVTVATDEALSKESAGDRLASVAIQDADSEPHSVASDQDAAQVTQFRHRTLAQAALLGGFVLDLLVYGLAIPLLPGQAQRLGASPLLIGALFATYAAGFLVATPTAGWLADRIGPKRTLLSASLLMLAATLLFAYAPSLALLYLARAIQGTSAACTWTAGLAFIAQRYSDHKRTVIFSRTFLAEGAGLLLGPPLGGVLYSVGGFQAPFLFAAGLALLDGLGRFVLLPADPTSRRLARSRAGEGRRRNGYVLAALLATLAGGLLLSSLEPVLAPFLAASFGLQTLSIGILFGGLLLIYSLAQPLLALAVRWIGAPRIICAGFLLSAAGLVALGYSKTLPQASAALAGIALGVGAVLGPTLQMLSVSPHEVGIADAGIAESGTAYGARYAAYNLAYALGIFLGPLLSGAATTWFGSAEGLMWLGGVPLVVVLLFVFLLALRRK